MIVSYRYGVLQDRPLNLYRTEASLVGEYTASGLLLRRYVHGAGVDEPVVWYEGSGLGDARFYHANHQGSIVAVAGSTGARIQTNAYDAYGIPNEAYVGERTVRVYRADLHPRASDLPLQGAGLLAHHGPVHADRSGRV